MKAVIILAAGCGSRLNLGYNKMLYEINGIPLYEHVLKAFEGFKIYFVSNDIFPSNVIQVKGGNTRGESVYNALLQVKEEYVLIHDGARPFVSKRIIDECEGDCFYVGVRPKDTIRMGKTTLNREELIIAQTPQGGKTLLFKEAYKKAFEENKEFTDDISVVLNYFDTDVKLIEGDYENIKITTKDDIDKYNQRIGKSFDVHRLVENRKLILGGVYIPYEKGLLGHSDADVLYHSVAESILGALALGDLGKLFPDNDPKYKDLDSSIIVKEAVRLMKEKNYLISNIDSMVYCEKPKLANYILDMRKNIADLLETDLSNVSVKATTYEKLGEIGEGLAIASESIVLLKKR